MHLAQRTLTYLPSASRAVKVSPPRMMLSGLRQISTMWTSALSPHSLSLRAWLNSCNASLGLFSYLHGNGGMGNGAQEGASVYMYVWNGDKSGTEYSVQIMEVSSFMRVLCYVQEVELGAEDMSLLERCLYLTT